MKIKARIEKMLSDSKVRAIASVSLDGQFVIKGLRIVDGNKGLFVTGPSLPIRIRTVRPSIRICSSRSPMQARLIWKRRYWMHTVRNCLKPRIRPWMAVGIVKMVVFCPLICSVSPVLHFDARLSKTSRYSVVCKK